MYSLKNMVALLAIMGYGAVIYWVVDEEKERKRNGT
jgi:hypothetical protein